MPSQPCALGLWCAQGCRSMGVSSKVGGGKVGSRGMGRRVSSGQGWCSSLEPAQGLIPPRGMVVVRTSRTGIPSRGALGGA